MLVEQELAAAQSRRSTADTLSIKVETFIKEKLIMQIRTFSQLIEWDRLMHANLAQCLAYGASRHGDERASSLLEYLASHESEMEDLVTAFDRRADPSAAHTYLYDCIPNTLVTTHLVCDDYYAKLDAHAITAAVLDFHQQIIALYRTLIGKEKVQQAAGFIQSLLDKEEAETKRLAMRCVSMEHSQR